MKLILSLDGPSIPNVVFTEVMKQVPKTDASDIINEVIIHGPNRYASEFINRIRLLFPNASISYRPAYIGDYLRNRADWEELIKKDIRTFEFHQRFVAITFVSFPHSVWCAYGHSSHYTDDAYVIASSGIIRDNINFHLVRIPAEFWNRKTLN